MRFSRARLLAAGAVGVVALLVSACTGGTWTGNDGSKLAINCPDAPTAAPTAATSGTCDWSYAPPTSSTTAVPPTTTTTVPTTTTTTTTTVPPTTTTTSTSTPPPPGGFPTPDTTGAPAGTAFAPAHNGDFTITTSGTYDRLHVTGTLYVKAPNVRVTNSWVEGKTGGEEALINNSTGLQVSYTTIGSTGCNPQPGIGEANYVADHVKITGMGDGFRVSGNNVTIQDSFVQTCDDPNNHDDGLQIYCPSPDVPQPCHDIVVNHSTLSNAGTRNFTAPLFGGQQSGGNNGQLANSRFTNNMLYGGVFSIYLYGTGLTITGNRIATNPWKDPSTGITYNGWVYGASDVTCSTVTWSDNRAVSKDNNWQIASDKGALNCA